jgi:sulfatase maturation enzyme AslB (radical SAM superfamily)
MASRIRGVLSRFFQVRSVEELELENLAFILTDRCNYDCSYCYEGKGTQRLTPSLLTRAIDLLHPYLARQCVVSFYGGEPLLEFGLVRQAVEHFKAMSSGEERTIGFSLTTNGSLLDEEILEFLAQHRFSLALSFDGLAQDISRKRGSFDSLVSIIPKILENKAISLETNSVFGSDTVGDLSESVKLLIQLGVPKVDINFAHIPPWTPATLSRLEEELDRMAGFFLGRYEDLRDIPWPDFVEEPRKAVHVCPAGVDRMAVSADGALWGCAVFPHYLREKYGPSGCQDYCFGDIDSFAKDPGRIYARKIAAYADLRMDLFSTPDRPCLMCDEMDQCWTCPLAAGLTTGEIGKIPATTCQRARILRRAKRRFREQFEDRARRNGNEAPG